MEEKSVDATTTRGGSKKDVGGDEKKQVVDDRKPELRAEYRADSKGDGGLTAMQEKHRAVEVEEEREVEEEFRKLMLQSSDDQDGEICIAKDPLTRKKALGFRIVSMNMRDAVSGGVIWQQNHFNEEEMFRTEMQEQVPKSVLSCKSVSREIVFSSVEALTELRLEQRVIFKGSCIEQWVFAFGYVIPGSTNSWQQVIEAAPPDQMLPSELLSGNLVFETAFYDGADLMGKTLVRIYYV
jgi:retinal rod rhodopsin-sensitive cGMP 3',5'-cyclic phosphodiesterase subunit delta